MTDGVRALQEISTTERFTMYWYYVSYNWLENDGTLIGTFSQSIYAKSQEAAVKCAARGCSLSEDDNDDGMKNFELNFVRKMG